MCTGIIGSTEIVRGGTGMVLVLLVAFKEGLDAEIFEILGALRSIHR